MKKVLLAAPALVLAAAMSLGCASRHEEGVKSNIRSQWSAVMADVETTTAAAKAVFVEEGLKSVDGSATKVDGYVTGTKADGTLVKAAIAKDDKGSNSSVTVTVGKLGDPDIGAEIARKIMVKAEGGPAK